MSEEKSYLVTIYNPFANAYCQVPLEQAEKLIESVEEVKKNIETAKIEKEKDDLYSKSLKNKKNEK